MQIFLRKLSGVNKTRQSEFYSPIDSFSADAKMALVTFCVEMSMACRFLTDEEEIGKGHDII